MSELDEDFDDFVSFKARSDRCHSTSLPWAEAIRLGAFIAWSVNGGPLPREHGGPLRMIVPGKYFYKSLKWLETIERLPADRLGYWEAEAGYHNAADPWLEQRYVASSLNRQQAAALIASRDFSARDLRGLSAADRELEGLQAVQALLRNADFRRSKLRNSNFRGANLSNARFGGADCVAPALRKLTWTEPTLSCQILRGADLSVATMFGTTFGEVDDLGQVRRGARIDATTRVDREKLEALVAEQRDWLLSQLVSR